MRTTCLLTVYLVALCIPGTGYAQINRDSLVQALARMPVSEEKAKAYRDLAIRFESIHIDSAAWAYDEAIQAYEKAEQWNPAARTCLQLSGLMMQQFRSDEAKAALVRAQQLSEHINDPVLNLDIHYTMGESLVNEGNLAQAIDVYAENIESRIKLNPADVSIGMKLAQLGYFLVRVGEFDEGFDKLEEGIAFTREHVQTPDQAYALPYILTLMANSYAEIGDYEQAIAYEEQALQLTEVKGTPFNILVSRLNISGYLYLLGAYEQSLESRTYFNAHPELLHQTHMGGDFNTRFGQIYFEMGDIEQARVYFNNAREIYEHMKLPAELATFWGHAALFYLHDHNADLVEQQLTHYASVIERGRDSLSAARTKLALGEVYLKQQKWEEARKVLAASKQYFIRKQLDRETNEVNDKLARVFLGQGDFQQSMPLAMESLNSKLRRRSKKEIASAHDLLCTLYKQTGDAAKALYHLEQKQLYLDSIRTNEVARLLAKERVVQNIADIEDEKQHLQREADLLSTRSRLYLALGTLLLLILGAGTWFYLRLRHTKQLLNKQNEQLAALNQTKDKFFGIIAHDLRNPLSAFQGVGEQLNYYLEKGDLNKVKTVSANLQKSAQRLSHLLDTLLSWAMLNRGLMPYHPEVLTLHKVVEHNMLIHDNAVQAKGIEIEMNIPETHLVFADVHALQAILRNIISNAVKFTPRDGKVMVSSEVNENGITISIRDNGVGMSQERIRDLYNVGKRSQLGTGGEQGAGMGLLLTKELIHINHGTLHVESREGAGTHVSFTLPARAPIAS